MAIDEDTVRRRDDGLYSVGDPRGVFRHCGLACMAMEVRCIMGGFFGALLACHACLTIPGLEAKMDLSELEKDSSQSRWCSRHRSLHRSLHN